MSSRTASTTIRIPLRGVRGYSTDSIASSSSNLSTPRPRSSIFDLPKAQSQPQPEHQPQPEQRRTPSWRLDPYKVMAASAVRLCMISKSQMPRDYLLALNAARTPSQAILLPDLQHPKFAPKRPGKQVYVSLHPEAVGLLHTPKGRHVAWLRSVVGSEAGRGPSIPPRIGEMVGDGLGIRVRQEAELLRNRVGRNEVLRVLGEEEVQKVRNGEMEGILGVIDLRLEPGSVKVEEAESKVEEAESKVEEEPVKVGEILKAEDKIENIETNTKPGETKTPIPIWSITLCGEHAPSTLALIHQVLARQRGAKEQDQPTPDYVAIQLLPESSPRRDLGIPLFIALTRAALWKGQGWSLKWVWPKGDGSEAPAPEGTSN